MREFYVLFLVASAAFFALAVAEDEIDERGEHQKLISTFQIVRFPNDACTASASRNGTCYTSAECSDKGGTSSGSCADGFGVCCQFVISTCGQTSSENITYFENPTTVPSGHCALTICPLNENIGQLRIDFTTFVITGPSTNTYSQASSFNGWMPQVTTNADGRASASSWGSNCLADSFSISSVSTSSMVPDICGTNTGYHMYVEADPNCNEIAFDLASSITATITDSDNKGVTGLGTRSWDMTILQYERGFVNQAPVGCTNYQWGPTTGYVTTYNYLSGSKHLANQNQRVCIRRERGICWAAWYGSATSLSLGGEAGVDNGFSIQGHPCGRNCETFTSLGGAGNGCSYDCAIFPGVFVVASQAGVIIPAATAAQARLNAAATNHAPGAVQISSGGEFTPGDGTIAGNSLGTGAGIAIGDSVTTTMFSWHAPYTVIFKTDGIEGHGGAGDHLAVNGNANTGIGANIQYDLISCT